MDTSSPSHEAIVRDLRQLWSRLRQGEIGRGEVEFYGNFISPGDLCFDIGANKGTRTAILLEAGARVVAVEPQQKCVMILKELFGDYGSVEIVKKGVGECEGTVEMAISSISEVSSMSSEWRDAFHMWENEEVTWTSTEVVEMTTLDYLIRQYGKPKYIKIDVEGFESQVLMGLSESVPALSFEYHTFLMASARQCLDILSKLGDILVNFTIEDSMRFVLGDWLPPDEAMKELACLENTPPWYGDIYVRFQEFPSGRA